MRAWLMEGDGAAAPRAPHHRTPDVPMGGEELAALGVLRWSLDPVEYQAGTFGGAEGGRQFSCQCAPSVQPPPGALIRPVGATRWGSDATSLW